MTWDDRLGVLDQATPLIWVHFISVMAALVLGGLILWRGKGDATHRLRGRVWVGLVLVGALTSFGIRDINPGGFSVIHILSVFVLSQLLLAVWAIRRWTVWPHGLRVHRMSLQFTYAAGLVIAGGANLLPGRLVGRFFFGDAAHAGHYIAAGISGLIGLWLIYRIVRPSERLRAEISELERTHEKGPGMSAGA